MKRICKRAAQETELRSNQDERGGGAGEESQSRQVAGPM